MAESQVRESGLPAPFQKKCVGSGSQGFKTATKNSHVLKNTSFRANVGHFGRISEKCGTSRKVWCAGGSSVLERKSCMWVILKVSASGVSLRVFTPLALMWWWRGGGGVLMMTACPLPLFSIFGQMDGRLFFRECHDQEANFAHFKTFLKGFSHVSHVTRAR